MSAPGSEGIRHANLSYFFSRIFRRAVFLCRSPCFHACCVRGVPRPAFVLAHRVSRQPCSCRFFVLFVVSGSRAVFQILDRFSCPHECCGCHVLFFVFVSLPCNHSCEVTGREPRMWRVCGAPYFVSCRGFMWCPLFSCCIFVSLVMSYLR